MKKLLFLFLILFYNTANASLPNSGIDSGNVSDVSNHNESVIDSISSDLVADYYNEAHNDSFYYDNTHNNAAPE